MVLPHLDYTDIILGDQMSSKSEMDRLKEFRSKMSSMEALEYFRWVPLAGWRFRHHCVAVQNAIKGDTPDHLESFRFTLSDLYEVIHMLIHLDLKDLLLNG